MKNNLAIKTVESIVRAARFNGALKVNLSREEDPTGQWRNRANLNKKIKVRLANAQKEIIELFKAIPRTPRIEKNIALNQETFTVYDYELTAEQEEQLETQTEEIIAFWLIAGMNKNKPFNFYSDPNIEEAYRTGSLESFRDINQDLNAISAKGGGYGLPDKVDSNQYVFSGGYQDSIAGHKNDTFYQLKGLSEKTSGQVYERITSGIKANKTPREITKDIKKRFSVSESNAKRIVNTQVNKVYNDSIIDTIKFLKTNTGLNVVGQHRSALLSTTRTNHAARHEKLYTAAQQSRWWDSGANRINCYCSFKPVILDKNNKPILPIIS